MLNSPNNQFLPGKLRILLILFIILDLTVSFNQFYNTPIDGDITSIVLPTERYKAVLKDPAGFDAITSTSGTIEPNRFFAIGFIYEYYRTVPFAAQTFMSPINSIYFSSAFLKIVIQILIMLMLAIIVTGKINFRNDKFLISIALASVFFQVGGYSVTMGIIDSAVSYTVYYALTFVMTIILFYPFIKQVTFENEVSISRSRTIFYFILAITTPFMSNLAPLIVIALLITGLAGKLIFKTDPGIIIKKLKADKRYFYILLLFVVLCLYSYFISLYSAERNIHGISYFERLTKIPGGLKNIFFGKPGLWVLVVLIGVNIFILKKIRPVTQEMKIIKWLSFFFAIYILVLPMDGYFDFRPNIVRRDNFIPATFCLILLLIVTTIKLIDETKVNPGRMKITGVYILIVMLFYSIADLPLLRIDNCQRASLEMLSVSDEKIVELSDRCNLASWYLAEEVKDSEVNAQVFYFWKITKEPKYYYQF